MRSANLFTMSRGVELLSSMHTRLSNKMDLL